MEFLYRNMTPNILSTFVDPILMFVHARLLNLQQSKLMKQLALFVYYYFQESDMVSSLACLFRVENVDLTLLYAATIRVLSVARRRVEGAQEWSTSYPSTENKFQMSAMSRRYAILRLHCLDLYSPLCHR